LKRLIEESLPVKEVSVESAREKNIRRGLPGRPAENSAHGPENANDFSDGAKVAYESKDGKTSKTFDAPDWLRGEPGCKHSRS